MKNYPVPLSKKSPERRLFTLVSFLEQIFLEHFPHENFPLQKVPQMPAKRQILWAPRLNLFVARNVQDRHCLYIGVAVSAAVFASIEVYSWYSSHCRAAVVGDIIKRTKQSSVSIVR